MSSTSTPAGYQLGNTYNFPSNSNNTLGVSVLRVDDDDDTTAECGAVTGGQFMTGAGSYTATVDPATCPAGYHYVYKFVESAPSKACITGYHFDYMTGNCVPNGGGTSTRSSNGGMFFELM